MDTIPLRDAVRSLRAEIISATEDAANQAVRFELGAIEMEFEVVAQKEAGGDGKVTFKIPLFEASLGASGKLSREQSHKVKLVLNPVLVDLRGERTKLEISRDAAKPNPDSKRSLSR